MFAVLTLMSVELACSALRISDPSFENQGASLQGGRFERVQIPVAEIPKYLSHQERLSVNQREGVVGTCTLEHPGCCLGATSGGGTTAWQAGRCAVSSGARYDERFQLVGPHGPEKMKDLVDALDRAPTSITWMGDSVLNQVWDAALCALHRKPGQYNVTNLGSGSAPTLDRAYPWQMGAHLSRAVDVSEQLLSMVSDAQFAGAVSAQRGDRIVHMKYLRAYRPLTATNATFIDLDSSALGQACATSDVLISNFGVHWNHDAEEDYEQQMGRLLEYLSYCVKRGGRLKTFIWIEPPPQHFIGPGGTFQAVTDGLDARLYTQGQMEQFAASVRHMSMQELQAADVNVTFGCFPAQHIDPVKSKSWRTRLFTKAVHDRGMQLSDLAKRPSSKHDGVTIDPIVLPALDVFVLPTNDFMDDLHYMHPEECTHWCYTPLTFEPIWHRLHSILNVEHMRFSHRAES